MNEMSHRQRPPDNTNTPTVTEPGPAPSSRSRHSSAWLGRVTIASVALISATGGYVVWQNSSTNSAPPAATMPLPEVTVAMPLADTVAPTTSFLGQFSAVDTVELRAQVGGTLLEINFRDGQVVRKGDRLFVIDPRPFQVRFDQADAQLHMAMGRKALADAELWRAQQLRHSSFRNCRNGRPACRRPARRRRNDRGRASGDPGCAARPRVLATYRPIQWAHRGASGLCGQPCQR